MNPRKAFEQALKSAAGDITSKILDFFKKNPKPSDKQVHEFATELGINEHRFEESIYKLLGTFVAGIGKHNNVPDDKYDQKELEMGIEVEKEHVADDVLKILPDLPKEIAKDHLDELSDYYTRLKKMEGEQAKHANDSRIAFEQALAKIPRIAFEQSLAKVGKGLQVTELTGKLDNVLSVMKRSRREELSREQLENTRQGLLEVGRALASFENHLNNYSRILSDYAREFQNVDPMEVTFREWTNLYGDLAVLRGYLRN